MRRTKEEKGLLEKLLSGKLDGRVGRSLTTSGGSSIWTENNSLCLMSLRPH